MILSRLLSVSEWIWIYYFGQRHIPDAEGRVGSRDNGIFIHAVVPRHVERVVRLSKGNISSKNVKVEFSLEDMDMSRFQQGATYEQIQDWVQEKYGFHVSHLNIAKTKRKCGIIERQNYNLPNKLKVALAHAIKVEWNRV